MPFHEGLRSQYNRWRVSSWQNNQPESEMLEPEASKSAMPFAALAKNMADLYPGKLMEQLTKTFGEYQLPGIDVDTLLEHNRKNVEALGAASKRMRENAETVMARQGEILRPTLAGGLCRAQRVLERRYPARPRHKTRRAFSTYLFAHPRQHARGDRHDGQIEHGGL